MGLLDIGDDPMMGLATGLLGASGPSRMPVSLGQALGAGVQSMNETRQQGMLNQMRQGQMDDMKRKRMALMGLREQLPEQMRPMFDVDPEGFLAQLNKVKEPIKLGAEEQLLDPTTYQPLAKGMTKADSVPSAIKEYQFAQQQGFRGSFADFEMAKRRAGASSVTVAPDNLGLRPKDRFEMEDKLRGDYSKATDTDAKILGTSAKMKAILNGDPNAVKDQAAIYSFAKLLDPDGAVREADYAAIMNTAGLSDRVRNYVNKLATGQSLSPTQRKEMIGVMEDWEKVARRRIGGAQKTYSSRAKMYNLAPENVFAPLEEQERPPLDSFRK